MVDNPMDRGDLSYLHEKLGEAIYSSMFDGSPETVAGVFEVISRAVHELGHKSELPPYLRDDEQAKDWLEKIKEYMKPSEADAKDPRAKELGTWYVRASRLSRDDKLELSRCIRELYHRVGRHGRD
jgi:hypothetical protein